MVITNLNILLYFFIYPRYRVYRFTFYMIWFFIFLFMIGYFHFINCDDNKKNRIFVLLNENFATIQFDNFLLGDTFSFLQFEI